MTTTAKQIARDILALRGPDPNGGPGWLVTADPALFMSAERLQLARKYSRLVPPGSSVADVPRLATTIAAHLVEHGNA